MLSYALAIFTGAFLLFQVQPLMGKYILPWFGGGPGVWTTCMLFFQVVLLGGYAYAHFITKWLNRRAQVLVHLAILAAALVLLPITPAGMWQPRGDGNPTLEILLLLAANLGLPYFVLSTTGPLLQQWFACTQAGVSPYRLYALSNVGSLAALVSYPLFFETHFTRRTQATLWCWGLGVYAVACGWCALRVWRHGEQSAGHGLQSTVQSPQSRVHGPQVREWADAQFDKRNNKGNDKGGTMHGVHSTLDARHPSLVHRVLWLLFPACASVLLLATTNKLCQDIAVIPFLWVMPLGLYLLSFVICFDSPRWYQRLPFALALILVSGGICWALFKGSDWSLWRQVAMYAGGLFVCCLVCHGELYRLRPDPRHLTEFYLLIAAGGAVGGIFVAVLAPLVFLDYYELNWGLFLCGFLFVLACAIDSERVPAPNAAAQNPASSENAAAPNAQSTPTAATGLRTNQWKWLAILLAPLVVLGLDRFLVEFGAETVGGSQRYRNGLRVAFWVLALFLAVEWVVRKRYRTFRHWRALTCVWLTLGVAALGITLWMQMLKSVAEVIYRSRNFYGVLTVYEYRPDQPKEHHFLLQHGRITHGLQFTAPERSGLATTYYGGDSGIGLALSVLPPGHRRIGLVGLGTGTLTTYAGAGDTFRIYEINPEVTRLASSRFTFLSNCAGRVELVLGDARLSMQKEPPQQFDLLALDAFSSDAIPVHLLTKEAFELYGRHLKTNGVIAVHISNHFLDLEPVVLNLARHFNYKVALIDYDDTDGDWWLYSSTWVLLTHDPDFLASAAICEAAGTVSANTARVPLWTDDFTSLFQILK
jgi:hypothetical protein